MSTRGPDSTPTVFVVDDDQSVRKGLSNLLRSAGYNTLAFASAQAFLEHSDYSAGCILLDMNMPGTNGLELQEQLNANGCFLPVVFLSGHGTVPVTAKAMKYGAVDFLEKPADHDVLLATVDDALKRDRQNRDARNREAEVKGRLEHLTTREFEVLQHVVAGGLNKQIASALGISEKTVKVHRAHIMEKMAVGSLAELVRLTESAGVSPDFTYRTKAQ